MTRRAIAVFGKEHAQKIRGVVMRPLTAPADAYKPETETIYGSPKYPSHLEFSVPE